MRPGPSLRRTMAMLGLAVPGGGTLVAQQLNDPPPVLQINIETVKSGRGSAHLALEYQWAEAFRRTGVAAHWLGAVEYTGDSNAWFFTPLRSVGELETLDRLVDAVPGLNEANDLLRENDAANVTANRSLLARYRPDLSRTDNSLAVGAARYFSLTTIRVRPGRTGEFVQASNLYKAAVTEAKSARHWATYEIISGMPQPTFLVFVTRKSLDELDPGTDDAAVQRAMTPERWKTFSQLEAASVLSAVNRILQFRPRMSYLPEGMTSLDPGFWSIKP